MTDVQQSVERVRALADHYARRAEIMGRFADQCADSDHYKPVADADADREHQIAADLRTLLTALSDAGRALEPFARAGQVWNTSSSSDDAKVFCDLWDDVTDTQSFGEAAPISDPEFTVGDFRRARATHSAITKQESDHGR